MEAKNNKTKWLHVRLSEQEYQQLKSGFGKTTERKFSDYIRKNLFIQPLIKTYRNKSMDDFVTVMTGLKTELNGLGNNFNQVVKRLHSFPESAMVMSMLNDYEKDRKKLLQQIEIIQAFIEKNAQQW